MFPSSISHHIVTKASCISYHTWLYTHLYFLQLLAEQKSEAVDQKVTELYHELMKLEMLLVDQLDVREFINYYPLIILVIKILRPMRCV